MISCERCCDRFRSDDCERSSSVSEELCLRLRVFFAAGSCARSGPALLKSFTITVTSGLSTLSSQASMVLTESQEIVLEEREGEGMGASLNSLEASLVL